MAYYPQYAYPNSYPTEMQCCPMHERCTLRVTGRGSVTVQPNQATVSLGVTTDGMNLTAVQSENAAAITAVITALERLGIAERDIATESYTITPLYDYMEGQQIFRGYRVQHTLRITVRNIAQVGTVIDTAVAAGANFVNNISFSVANPALYYQQALTLALESAIAKARTVGQKLNVNISSTPIRVVEQTFGEAPIEPAALKMAEAPTPIQPGQLEISAQVEAVFAYPCR